MHLEVLHAHEISICLSEYLNVTFIDGYIYDFATFVFSVSWFRGSARSCHASFHSVKY